MWRAALEVVLMPLLGLLLGWTGVMPELHLAALAWLALPQTNGALFMWHSVMLPAVLLGRQLLVRSGLVKDDQLGAGDKVGGPGRLGGWLGVHAPGLHAAGGAGSVGGAELQGWCRVAQVVRSRVGGAEFVADGTRCAVG